jgi:diguanylate cyclase (GGDEF)-like protein
MVGAEFQDKNLEDDILKNVEIKNLLNSLEEGAFVVDKDENIVFYNDIAPIILKIDLNEFLYKNIRRIYYFENLFKNQPIPEYIRNLASGCKICNICNLEDKNHYFENEKIDLFNESGEIKGALYLVRDITKEIQLEISLSNEVKTDNLSKLYNSRFFREELDKEISRCSRYGHDLSILFIDINNFKYLNDMLGHQAGDEIIRFTGETLMNAVRKNVDTAFRYGGDEFTVILPNTPAKRSTIVANRILFNFNNGFKEKLKMIMLDENFNEKLDNFTLNNDGKSKKIGLSIGITGFQKGKRADELIKEADIAMYRAKRGNGNQVFIYEE